MLPIKISSITSLLSLLVISTLFELLVFAPGPSSSSVIQAVQLNSNSTKSSKGRYSSKEYEGAIRNSDIVKLKQMKLLGVKMNLSNMELIKIIQISCLL